MSDEKTDDAASQATVETFVTYVVQRLKEKVPEPKIVDDLAEKGLDRETAADFVGKCAASYRSARKKAGGKDMLFGALWCVGGLIVTGLTYSMASSGGGRYVIAWGAVIFGGIQFFRGLYRFLSA